MAMSIYMVLLWLWPMHTSLATTTSGYGYDSCVSTEELPGINYQIYCNADELFITVSITDRKIIKTIAVHGLTIFVDPKGRKQTKKYLKYPVGIIDVINKDSERYSNSDNSKYDLFERFINTAEIKGLLLKKALTIDFRNINIGIAASFNIENDSIFTYMAKIPFRLLTKNNNWQHMDICFSSTKKELLPPDAFHEAAIGIKPFRRVITRDQWILWARLEQ